VKTRRVVVTGIGLTSPIGDSFDEVFDALRTQTSGIRIQESWKEIPQLRTFLSAPTPHSNLDFSKKEIRMMGRVSQLALRATLDAIKDSALSKEDYVSGRCGISYGSTQGSSEALLTFSTKVVNSGGLTGVRPSNYIKFMSHTCSVNLATFFGIRGRVITTCSACTSGSQGVGYAYEAIKFGKQDMMIAGGAEELHFSHAGVFDLLRATSTNFNEEPELSPRPFDTKRDGLVVGEGAATLVLEGMEHALKRGAKIYCEVIGFGSTCDGIHMTNPNPRGMASAMQAALDDAHLKNDALDYVNAHATGTRIGDVCESQASEMVLGKKVPISSTKGLSGHTLGAAGALESIVSIVALQKNFLPANSNLDTLDPECAKLNYVRASGDLASDPGAKVDIVMNNNFAFGGVNTSLIFRKI